MEYLHGQIHEKLQIPVVFEVNENWNIPLLKKRYDVIDFRSVWRNKGIDDDTYTLELKKHDIIIIRWFRPLNCQESYTYFDSVLRNPNNIFFTKEIVIKEESCVSKTFIEHNTTTRYKCPKLFTDITHQYNRDKKLNQILN